MLLISAMKLPALCGLLLFWFPASLCSGQGTNLLSPQTVTIPNTPAGTRITAWLQAFNSGNREALRQFIKENWQYDKPQFIEENSDRDSGLFQATRGLVLRKAETINGGIRIIAQAKLTEIWLDIKAYVDEKSPRKLVGFQLSFVDPPSDLVPHKILTEAEIRKNFDALLTRLVAADAFSGTVLLAKDGKPFYTRAAGLANRAWKIPNRVDTRYNLASITKMFTATAIVQLVEQGKLSYQDTIGKILPDYPNKDVAQKVTLHHLLSHTSGIPGASSKTEYDKLQKAIREGFRTLKEYTNLFAGDPLLSEPGSRLDYSNYGYILLGAVIEKVSGQNYYTYVREHIFKPLGMTQTDFDELDTDPPGIATGYMDAPNKTRLSNIFVVGVKGEPSGGAYATVGDLLKFDRALRSHKLYSAKSAELVWTGKKGTSDGYGYGCELSGSQGFRIVGHGGGWFGITNRFDMHLDLGYTVIILSNTDIEIGILMQKWKDWTMQGRTK